MAKVNRAQLSHKYQHSQYDKALSDEILVSTQHDKELTPFSDGYRCDFGRLIPFRCCFLSTKLNHVSNTTIFRQLSSAQDSDFAHNLMYESTVIQASSNKIRVLPASTVINSHQSISLAYINPPNMEVSEFHTGSTSMHSINTQ